MQFDYLAVGRTIRKLRIEKNMSQELLSGLAGIARSHLAMIETGSKLPNLETLWHIAQALGRKPSELIGEIEKESKQ